MQSGGRRQAAGGRRQPQATHTPGLLFHQSQPIGKSVIVQLIHAFQDDECLYMAMEYLPGGNLLTMLENFVVKEEWAQFYLAELIVALDVVHQVIAQTGAFLGTLWSTALPLGEALVNAQCHRHLFTPAMAALGPPRWGTSIAMSNRITFCSTPVAIQR